MIADKVNVLGPQLALSRDMSRAQSAKNVDGAAVDLLKITISYLIHVLRVDCINEIDIDLIDEDME